MITAAAQIGTTITEQVYALAWRAGFLTINVTASERITR